MTISITNLDLIKKFQTLNESTFEINFLVPKNEIIYYKGIDTLYLDKVENKINVSSQESIKNVFVSELFEVTFNISKLIIAQN